jgi:hypothetical protein
MSGDHADDFSLADEWETAVERRSSLGKVHHTAIQLTEPTRVAVVAERADVSKETARKYLDFFASVGILRQVASNPDTYDRNESYVAWKRIDDLRRTHSRHELIERLNELSRRDREFEDRFDADRPADVDLLEDGYDTAHETVSTVERWRGVRARIEDVLAALEDDTGHTSNATSSVETRRATFTGE